MDDEAFRALQNEISAKPDRGKVMPGCGGLRKLRFGDPSRGSGKRGGIRVIYLYIPEASLIDFVDWYGKDEKDDLSAAEKRFKMSQSVFAATLNVSTKLVQSWEQGTRTPDRGDLRLLNLLTQKPELVGLIMNGPPPSKAPKHPRAKSAA